MSKGIAIQVAKKDDDNNNDQVTTTTSQHDFDVITATMVVSLFHISGSYKIAIALGGGCSLLSLFTFSIH